MHNKKLYGTATVGTKGQIVIPADAREELAINPGDRLYVIGSPESGVVGLLKEGMLEQFIEQMNIQVESFKALKESESNK
jgi:AbrB family looped-hinge helix DNA binding protein